MALVRRCRRRVALRQPPPPLLLPLALQAVLPPPPRRPEGPGGIHKAEARHMITLTHGHLPASLSITGRVQVMHRNHSMPLGTTQMHTFFDFFFSFFFAAALSSCRHKYR